MQVVKDPAELPGRRVDNIDLLDDEEDSGFDAGADAAPRAAGDAAAERAAGDSPAERPAGSSSDAAAERAAEGPEAERAGVGGDPACAPSAPVPLAPRGVSPLAVLARAGAGLPARAGSGSGSVAGSDAAASAAAGAGAAAAGGAGAGASARDGEAAELPHQLLAATSAAACSPEPALGAAAAEAPAAERPRSPGLSSQASGSEATAGAASAGADSAGEAHAHGGRLEVSQRVRSQLMAALDTNRRAGEKEGEKRAAASSAPAAGRPGSAGGHREAPGPAPAGHVDQPLGRAGERGAAGGSAPRAVHGDPHAGTARGEATARAAPTGPPGCDPMNLPGKAPPGYEGGRGQHALPLPGQPPAPRGRGGAWAPEDWDVAGRGDAPPPPRPAARSAPGRAPAAEGGVQHAARAPGAPAPAVAEAAPAPAQRAQPPLSFGQWAPPAEAPAAPPAPAQPIALHMLLPRAAGPSAAASTPAAVPTVVPAAAQPQAQAAPRLAPRPAPRPHVAFVTPLPPAPAPKPRYAPQLGGEPGAKPSEALDPVAGNAAAAQGLISAEPTAMRAGDGGPSGGPAPARPGSAKPRLRRGLKDVDEDELCCPITQVRRLACQGASDMCRSCSQGQRVTWVAWHVESKVPLALLHTQATSSLIL